MVTSDHAGHAFMLSAAPRGFQYTPVAVSAIVTAFNSQRLPHVVPVAEFVSEPILHMYGAGDADYVLRLHAEVVTAAAGLIGFELQSDTEVRAIGSEECHLRTWKAGPSFSFPLLNFSQAPPHSSVLCHCLPISPCAARAFGIRCAGYLGPCRQRGGGAGSGAPALGALHQHQKLLGVAALSPCRHPGTGAG